MGIVLRIGPLCHAAEAVVGKWARGGGRELFSKVVDWWNEKGGVSFRVAV